MNPKDPFAYLQDPSFTPRTKQRLIRDHEDDMMNYNVRPKKQNADEMPPIRNSFKKDSFQDDINHIRINLPSPEQTSRQF